MPEDPVTLFDPATLLDAEELALEQAAATQPVPAPEPELPWDRQDGEPQKAYHAFLHFRAQPSHFHSCRAAYRDHVRMCTTPPFTHDPDLITEAPKSWRLWSAQWGWMDRAAAWDREVDRVASAKLLAQQVAARERHVSLAQAMLTVLSLPVKAAIEAAKDPLLVTRLIDAAQQSEAGAEALWAQVARLSGVIPRVVEMERLGLGLTTQTIGLAPPTPREDAAFAFADRIASDPAATQLAIQLLDHVHHAGPSLALGAGSLGESGDVDDSAAPESADAKAG